MKDGCNEISNLDFSTQKSKWSKACILESEKVLVLNPDKSIVEVEIGFFADFVENEERKLEDYKVFSRNGWSSVTSVHLRNSWENEKFFKVKSRSSQIIVTGDVKLPLIRSNKEIVVSPSEIQDGDALLIFVPLKLKDDLKGEDLTRQIVHQGIMKCEPMTKFPAKLVGLMTENESFAINDIIISLDENE